VKGVARSAVLRSVRPRSTVPRERGVALTFDDGPDPVFTPAVLDVLAGRGVQATFFVVGKRAERYPELVRRIAEDGHLLGSHSWSHREPGSLGARELARDYRRGRRAVETAAWRDVPLFRPPRGLWDARTAVLTRSAGLRTWLWTTDSEDWRPGATAEEIAACASAVPGGGVILLHDALELATAPEAEDRSATVAALPGLIDGIGARGLDLVRLDVERSA
jgi:peptidoglycan/xylan/chitin deacetylase (PgdA/CDA1 family)